MKATITYYISLLLLILTSCESPLHDNYIDITKPADIPIGIDLSAYAEGDNIIIYQENIAIHYAFETGGREVVKAEFTLGNLKRETQGNSGEIWFASYELPDGNYTLTCNLYVATNSGSLADQVGAEIYGGTKSWNVTVAYEKEPQEIPEMSTRINEEGYLELTWEKPYFKYREFINYTVYKSGELIATIDNADQTSIVDKSHVLDYNTWYTVKANFANDISWYVGTKNLPNKEITLEQIEDISAIDYRTVRWSNNEGYKCKWNVYVDDELKLKETEETSIKVPVCPFGAWNSHFVRVEVLTYEEKYREEYPPSMSINAGMIGKYLGGNFIRFGYNESEDALYYSIYSEINSVSVPDLTPVASHKGIPAESNTTDMCCSEKNGKVLAIYNYALALYDGKKLTTQQKYKIPFSSNWFGAQLLDDNRIFYFERNYQENVTGYLINSDMQIEKKINFDNSVSLYDGIISADGKYVYLENSDEMAVYKLSSDFSILERMDYPSPESSFSKARFMPKNSSQIWTRKVNSFNEVVIRLYNTEDMSLVKSCNAFHANLDPKTGYLCLTYKDEIKVVNMQNNDILFTIPCEPYQEVFLLGGILISNHGYALNINPYLTKK